MTLGAFWARADRLARASLFTAAATAAIHVATFAGLTSLGAGRILYAFHLIAMFLFGAVFLRMYRHHYVLAGRTGARNLESASKLPLWLTAATIAAIIYGVALFSSMAQFGEGYPQEVAGGWAWMQGDALIRRMTEAEYRHFFALELRMFSSWWLFFSLIACCGAYTYGERLKALREAGAVGERRSLEFFLAWPKKLLWSLVIAAVVGQIVVVVGLARGAEFVWRLGAVVVQASVLVVALRFAYLFERRFFGRWLAMATMAFVCIGFVWIQIASLADAGLGPRWLHALAGGLDIARWAAFIAVPVVGGWAMFRALRRVSGR